MINARSIWNKTYELELLLAERNVDVAFITESWVSNNDVETFAVPNYTVIGSGRLSRRGGGVLILTKSMFCPISIELGLEQEIVEYCCCELTLTNGDKLLCCSVYRPPVISVDVDKQYRTFLSQLATLPHEFKCVCGDFNLPLIRWDLMQWPLNMEIFMDTFLENGWHQHVKFPTRGVNILDLVFTSIPAMVPEIQCEPPLSKTADHAVVSFTLDCNSKVVQHDVASRINWNKVDWNNVEKYLSSYNLISLMNPMDMDHSWYILKSTVSSAIKASSFNKSSTSNKPIWANKSAIKALTAKRNAHHRFKRTGTQSSYECFVRAATHADNACHASIKSFEKKLADNIKSDAKSFYAYARRRQRVVVTPGPFRKSDGDITTSQLEDANLLATHFESVFNLESFDEPTEYPIFDGPPINTCSFDPLLVAKAIDQLSSSCSAGPDGIPNIALKRLRNILAIPLSFLFSSSMRLRTVPEDWKKAIIQPLHKSGPRYQVSNFRPISLSSSTSKLMERIIRASLLHHLTSNNLLKDSQHGFLPGCSTTTQLITFLDFVSSALDDGDFVDAILLDFSKAFDKIIHKALLFKLDHYGIQGDLLMWIASFLSERTQQVRVGDQLSRISNVLSGVPQGTVLGPILFNIFVDDIDNWFSKSIVLKYADDIKIMKRLDKIDFAADSSLLQADLNFAAAWADNWKLPLNVNKCKCMHFGTLNPATDYYFDDQMLQSVFEVKDLGIHFNYRLTFSTHCAHIASKADRVVAMIRHSFRYLTKTSFINLYCTLVRPLLEYASSVFCPHYAMDIHRLEGVQRRATKLLIAIRHLPYADRLKALNLQSLETRRHRADLILLWKIVHGKTNIQWAELFTMPTGVTRGHSMKLELKRQSNLNCRRFFFCHRVLRQWNNLTDDIVTKPTVNSFKQALHSFGGPFNTNV